MRLHTQMKVELHPREAKKARRQAADADPPTWALQCEILSLAGTTADGDSWIQAQMKEGERSLQFALQEKPGGVG